MDLSFSEFSMPQNKALYSIDARCKIAGFIAFIFLCSAVKNIYLLAGVAVLIMSLNIFQGKGLIFVLKRFLLTLPFGLMLIILMPFTTPGRVLAGNIMGIGWLNITYDGTYIFLRMLFKYLISIYTLLLLSSTTPLNRLLSGFRDLKVPPVFITLIDFTLRYFTLFKSEIDRMIIARKSRAFNEKSGIKAAIETGSVFGYAFIRAFDRSTRIYNSMISRGYDSESNYRNGPRAPIKDYIFGAGIIIFGLTLIVIDRSGLIWNMQLV